MSGALQQWLATQLFDRVPCNVFVIDRSYRIVENNRGFVDRFGDGRERRCYEVFKRRDAPCERCAATETFEDGQVRVNGEVGVDKDGGRSDSVVHFAPIFDARGRVSHIVEMATDVTEVKRLKRGYDALFDQVPCYLAVLNRDLRIVRANEQLHGTFGATTGQHCYEILKRRQRKCADCPAEQTFADGQRHATTHVGVDSNGDEVHYAASCFPLRIGTGGDSYVMAMALDVTENRRLRERLAEAMVEEPHDELDVEPMS